jgi:hypothetical protein
MRGIPGGQRRLGDSSMRALLDGRPVAELLGVTVSLLVIVSTLLIVFSG